MTHLLSTQTEASTCLRLLQTSSVGDVVDVVDSCRVLASSAAVLQLQRKHDVVESRIL